MGAGVRAGSAGIAQTAVAGVTAGIRADLVADMAALVADCPVDVSLASVRRKADGHCWRHP